MLIKATRITFLTCACLFCFGLILFAQDSTLVAEANGLIGFATGKWPVAATIFGIVALVSEILSIIPDKYVPANGVFHAIWLFIKSVTWKK